METKSVFASKGVWGSVVAILAVAMPSLLKLVGLEGEVAPDEVMNLISQVVALVGAGFALWGRLAAKKPLSLTGTAK